MNGCRPADPARSHARTLAPSHPPTHPYVPPPRIRPSGGKFVLGKIPNANQIGCDATRIYFTIPNSLPHPTATFVVDAGVEALHLVAGAASKFATPVVISALHICDDKLRNDDGTCGDDLVPLRASGVTLSLWGTTLICGLVALAMPVLAGLMFRLKRSTATALHRHVTNPRLKVVPLVGVLTTARKGSALIVTVYVGLNVLLLAMWWKEKAVKATGMLAAVRSPKPIRGHRHAVDTPRIRTTHTDTTHT